MHVDLRMFPVQLRVLNCKSDEQELDDSADAARKATFSTTRT